MNNSKHISQTIKTINKNQTIKHNTSKPKKQPQVNTKPSN